MRCCSLSLPSSESASRRCCWSHSTPAAKEQLSLADDMLAVRAAFDQMLVDKGLIIGHQLDLMVSRSDAGQFAAQ